MKKLPLLLMLSTTTSMLVGLLLRRLLSDPVDPQAFLELRVLLPLILVMPFMETLIIHFLIVEAFLRIGNGRTVALYLGLVLSSACFFFLHYAMNGAFNGFVYGLVGGVFLSVMYGWSRGDGRQAAFFNTWMLHAASNVILVISMAFYGMAIGRL